MLPSFYTRMYPTHESSSAPAIVILKDRGQTLRFYRPNQLRMSNGALREFIKREGWVVTPPWTGAFAPGGSR